MRCSLVIDLDNGPTTWLAWHGLALVEVPDRRSTRRAADLGFASHALERLGAVVTRLVLGTGGENAVHEFAGRGVVDVLLHRDNSCTCGSEVKENVGVVASVAGEPVDLVQDDEVDVSLPLNPRHHPVKLRPVSGLGALALVDILLDDFSAELFRFPQAGIPLSRE
ncbi:MAG: hypothetical protein AAF962_26865 [Actinomycetota bacterium]